MRELERSDEVKALLVQELRGRARSMRRIAYVFVAAIIAVIVGAVAFYYYVPTITRQQQEARIEANQTRIVELDRRIETARQEFTALRENAAATILTGGTEITNVRQPPNLRRVTFADPRTGWAVGLGGVILATTDGGASWTP